jgi:hypothetical protein
LTTPAKVYEAIQKTIASGCPSAKRIQEDVDRILSTLQRIIDAKGSYISDSARHGVREERRRITLEEKEEKGKHMNRQDPRVVQKFHDMFEKLTSGRGLPFKIDTTQLPLFAIDDVESGDEEVSDEESDEVSDSVSSCRGDLDPAGGTITSNEDESMTDAAPIDSDEGSVMEDEGNIVSD